MGETRRVLATNRRFYLVMTFLLVPAFLLAVAGCESQPGVMTTVVEEPDRTIVTETYETTTEVTNIDVRERQVTLRFQDGSTDTFTASDEVRNFDQIRVGDQVHITVYEEVAVFLRGHGAPPDVDEAAAVGLAPKGEKPGIVVGRTVQLTGRIANVDTQGRQVTLELSDGSMETVKVRNRKVDLTKVKPGDNVVIQVTQAVVIQVKES